MRKVIGAVLIVLSLACITSAVVDVLRGKAGLWCPMTVGSYAFHFVTMLAALFLIAPGPEQDAAEQEAS